MSDTREELRKKLHSKLSDKKIGRFSKEKKEIMLSKSLKKDGIDKEKLKKDIEALKKQGGFTKEQQEYLKRMLGEVITKEQGGLEYLKKSITKEQKKMLEIMGIPKTP